MTGSTTRSPSSSPPGHSPPRVEDEALLTGSARFGADLPLPPNGAHAAFVRSPMAHARIRSLDPAPALAMPGVHAVLTGADVLAWSDPFIVAVRSPLRHYALAVDRVRYVGEPVAVVVARDRYLAEDAAERVELDLEPLDAVVDPERALAPEAPVLHPEAKSNLVHERHFRYGDPDDAFARAAHRVRVEARYPRNACTPIEGFVVTAEHLPEEDAWEICSNFQGPFSLHPVMARALRVPGPRLRLRAPPFSGGSFGVKQAVFPYVVALALAARKAARPVRWVEDRLEHLMAATSATNRVMRLEAAVDGEGRVLALDWDQIEDCGAWLRAPEPATLYRMHGNLTGAYDIPSLRVRNRVVVTNKTPTGLNRGFGGPQVYYALESLMRRIALELDIDPLEVIRRNLVPADAFPYRCAAGALLDGGDYGAVVAAAAADGELEELLERRRRARAEGRLFGIGFAAVVEPSISNMGYITTLLTPAERARAGPKNGAIATATVAVDPSGSVVVTAASVPQGQGHRSVLAQVVADVLGIDPGAVTVNLELDTVLGDWSIASGNYSSRFAGAVAGTAHLAALEVRERLARIAAPALNERPERLVFEDGLIRSPENPANALPVARVAGLAHWSPGLLPEGMEPGLRVTAHWSPPELEPPDEADRINSSLAYGFVFDICALEVDRATGQVRIERYVTAHDAGTRLHPAMVDGQIRGGFAQALGAALFESLRYSGDGDFLSGSLAEYAIPTACEVPEPVIVHRDTPCPFTPLGARGVGEGSSMSTPVAIANAVADAIGYGEERLLELPLTPARVARLVWEREGGEAGVLPGDDAPGGNGVAPAAGGPGGARPPRGPSSGEEAP